MHLTLQEFCAAQYISKKLSLENQQQFLKLDRSHDITRNPDGLVGIFYSGITGLKNKKNVEHIVPYGHSKPKMLKVVHLINCAYEAHNFTACQMIGSVLDGNIDLTGCGTCVLFPAFRYFLKHLRSPIKTLKISNSFMDDERFMELLSLLEERLSKRIDTNFTLEATDTMISHKSYFLLAELLSSRLPVVELCIGKKRNVLDTEIKHQIRSSSLSKLNNSLLCSTLTNLKSFTSDFAMSTTLRVLDVSGLKIGPEGAAYLAGCRGVVLHEVRISGCELGPTGADKIGEMVYYNKSIASVNLAYNMIGDSGVKNLVSHLVKHTNTIQILNLEGNNVSAIGARYLRKLIRKGRISIELCHNPLRDKGVQLVLQAVKVIMDHIGLVSVGMTSSSIPYIAVVLDKVKSIGFTIPCFRDYEVIMDRLAKTNVLESLKLHLWGGFKPKYKTMKAFLTYAHGFSPFDPFYQLFLYRNAPSLAHQLYFGTSFQSCEGSGVSVSCINLDIKNFKNSVLPKDLPLIDPFTDLEMKTHKETTSVDKAFALLILLQLKRQSYTLKKLTLKLSSKLKMDLHFSSIAEKYITKINDTRRKQGFAEPLLVDIIFEGKFVVALHTLCIIATSYSYRFTNWF